MPAISRTTKAVHTEFVAYADAHDVDLVILTKQTHDTADRVLLGSVVNNFIRHSKRKIMVAPAKQA